MHGGTRLIFSIVITAFQIIGAQNIVQAEVFIDDDPGFGNGTPLSFTPASDVDVVFEIDVSSLNDGYHVLSIRATDENGLWTLLFTRPFLKQSIEMPANMTGGEYFIGSDPGFSNGTAFNIPQGIDITHDATVDVSGLDNGFHSLGIRSKDANGRWSLTYVKPFLIQTVDSVSNINLAEYFIGSDPGFSNGTAFNIPQGIDITHDATVDVSGLDNGFHSWGIRSKDANGRWSLTYMKPLLKESVILDSTRRIRSIEYFFAKNETVTQTYTHEDFTPSNDVDVNFYANISDLNVDSIYSLYLYGINEKEVRSLDHIYEFELRIVNSVPDILNPMSDMILHEDFDSVLVGNLDTVFTDADIPYGDSLHYSVNETNELVIPTISEGVLYLNSFKDAYGTSTLLITATDDSSATVTDTFIVTVNPVNDPPYLSQSLPNVTIDEDDFGAVAIPRLEDYFDDLDIEDHLAFSGTVLDAGLDSVVIGNQGNMNLSGWLSSSSSGISSIKRSVIRRDIKKTNKSQFGPGDLIDIGENKIPSLFNRSNTLNPDRTLGIASNAESDSTSLIVYPTENFNGDIRIAVTATDDSLASLSDTLVLTVIPLNDPPVLTALSDTSMSEDDTLNLTLSAYDPDGDTLTFSAKSDTAAANVSVTDEVLGITLEENWNGSTLISVVASDTALSDTSIFTLTVMPLNDLPALTALVDTTMSEDDTLTLLLSAYDVDGDSLTLSAQSDTSAVTLTVSDSELVILPEENWNGISIILAVASDSALSDTSRFTLAVEPIDDPPTLVNPVLDILISEDAPDSVIRDLNDVFNDVDSDLIFSHTNSDTNLIEVLISGDLVTLHFLADAYGSAQLIFTATSSEGPAVSDTVQVTVTPVNDVPYLSVSLPDVTIDEDDFGAVIIPRLEDHFDDVDKGDHLAFSADPLDVGLDSLSFSTMGRDVLSTLGKNIAGVFSIKRSTVTQVDRKTVNAVRDNPGQAKFGGTTKTLSFSSDSRLLKMLSDGTSEVLIGAADSRALVVYPTENFNGEIRIAVTARDDSLASVSDTLVLTVAPLNDPPVLSALHDTLTDEDQTLTLPLTAYDADGDSLTFGAESDTSAVIVTVSDTNLRITPQENWFGTNRITVSAADADTSVAEEFTLNVIPVNDAPSTFSLISPSDSAVFRITSDNVNENLLIEWENAADVDGDSIWYVLDLQEFSGRSLRDTALTSNTITIKYQTFVDSANSWAVSTFSVLWTVSATDRQDTTRAYNGPYTFTINVSDELLDILSPQTMPTAFALSQNFPNPFNPSTTIRYDLPQDSPVTLVVYDILGREVTTLVNEAKGAGFHSAHWDGKNMHGEHIGAGVYLYRIQARDFSETRKMVLLR